MPPSFLTRQGYEKLLDELEYLRTTKRQEVANRLHEAGGWGTNRRRRI
jgi:transcription elongation factor GreA